MTGDLACLQIDRVSETGFDLEEERRNMVYYNYIAHSRM